MKKAGNTKISLRVQAMKGRSIMIQARGQARKLTHFFAILANIITLSGWKISRQIVVFPADFLFFPLFYYIKNRDEKLG